LGQSPETQKKKEDRLFPNNYRKGNQGYQRTGLRAGLKKNTQKETNAKLSTHLIKGIASDRESGRSESYSAQGKKRKRGTLKNQTREGNIYILMNIRFSGSANRPWGSLE